MTLSNEEWKLNTLIGGGGGEAAPVLRVNKPKKNTGARSSSQIHFPLLRDKVDYGIGLSYLTLSPSQGPYELSLCLEIRRDAPSPIHAGVDSK